MSRYAGSNGPTRNSGAVSERSLERKLEGVITKMESFQSEEQYRLAEQLTHLPKQYLGHVLSIMQYKFLRDHLNSVMSDIIKDITPNLVTPMQNLSSALIFFSEAFADNLGTYYSIYGMNKHLVMGLFAIPSNNHTLIRERVDGILRGTIQALNKAQELRSASERLVNAMNGFNNAIISISGHGNYGQLENDVREAYERAEHLMMNVSKYQRDLVIAKATLKQAEDTSKSDEEIKRNLETRLRAELDSASSAQEQFSKALQRDGQITETKNTYYYGHWWWLGGRYSHTTKTVEDTSAQQASNKAKIRIADERVQEIRERIALTSVSRSKMVESAKLEIAILETKIVEVEYRAKEAFTLARKLEDDLNNARLETSGCNAETRIAISSSCKVAFPLFQRLTESISKVSANYETMKSIISNAGNIGIIELIGFTDEILKMAILGDYVTNNSFYLCCDPVMVELEKARGQKIHEALDIVRRAPAIEAGKVCALKSIVDSTNGKNKEKEELVFAVSEPVVLSVEDL